MKPLPLLMLVIVMIPSQSEEWATYESEHFTFYYKEPYLTEQELAAIAENQEALFSRLTDLLAIEFTKKIKYYLYGNRKDFEGIPGAYTAGTDITYLCMFCTDMCREGLNDAHELTHALSSDMGFQYGLLAEGLAVYADEYTIKGKNLHGIAKILYTENRLTSLEELMNDFWHDYQFNYDISGSFVTFLIEKYGMDQFKKLYATPLYPYSFEEVYGKSLDSLQEEWIAVILEAEITQKERDLVRYRDGIKEGLGIYIEIGFTPVEYGTYPARAEEGICLFRKEYKTDPEKAFSYLDQFNEGMVAWKEAISTFEEALQLEDYRTKAGLFRKALSLYEVAGDEDMIILAGKYAEAYELLVEANEYLDSGDQDLAVLKFMEAKPLFEELGEWEEVTLIQQQVETLRDRVIEGSGLGLIIFAACVLMGWGVIRHRSKRA